MNKIKAVIKERWGRVRRNAYIPVTLIAAPFVYLAIIISLLPALPFALLVIFAPSPIDKWAEKKLEKLEDIADKVWKLES